VNAPTRYSIGCAFYNVEVEKGHCPVIRAILLPWGDQLAGLLIKRASHGSKTRQHQPQAGYLFCVVLEAGRKCYRWTIPLSVMKVTFVGDKKLFVNVDHPNNTIEMPDTQQLSKEGYNCRQSEGNLHNTIVVCLYI
jgi:hypothetical protein